MPRRAPDPEQRRRDILAAAAEMIAEVGLDRVTHRAIAERAGVSLGSTTYYFPTLDALLEAALRHELAASRAQLAGWADALRAEGPVATVLSRLVEEYLADRQQALIDYELYLAAARVPRLRGLAVAWIEDARAALEPVVGPEMARALVTLIDGAMLEALVAGEGVDRGILVTQIDRLIR